MQLYPKDQKSFYESGSWIAYVLFDVAKEGLHKIRDSLTQRRVTNALWEKAAEADRRKLEENPSAHMPELSRD